MLNKLLNSALHARAIWQSQQRKGFEGRSHIDAFQAFANPACEAHRRGRIAHHAMCALVFLAFDDMRQVR